MKKTVVLSIGLFMIIASLEHNGVIEWLADSMLKIAGDNILLLCGIVLVGSAMFSMVLDNIPFVITMVPLLKLCFAPIAQSLGITDPEIIRTTVAEPLWWSLALGACLGGNGTLIGASANVVMAKICEKNKYKISFLTFSRYGLPFTVQAIAISMIYIWLRYFYFA